MGQVSSEGGQPPSVAVELGAGALGALVGYGIGGPAGAVVGNIAGTPLAKLYHLAAQEWQGRQEVALEVACRTAGMSDEDLVTRLSEDPRLSVLALRVLDAVRLTAMESKVRALGNLLGRAVRDREDNIDETALVVEALAQLEAPHVHVLELLERFGVEEAARRAQAKDDSRRAALFTYLTEIADVPDHIVTMALAGLVRVGATASATVYDGPGYELTSIGWALLEVLRGVPDGDHS